MNEQDRTARPGETRLLDVAPAGDAALRFIGRIRTPWTERRACPKNTKDTDNRCTIEVDPLWAQALDGLETASHVLVLYWLDQAERTFVVQAPSHAPRPLGTFALRSPNRPNPIGLGAGPLLGIEGTTLAVQGLDCVDGTPLLDLKPYITRTDSHPEATLGWRDR